MDATGINITSGFVMRAANHLDKWYDKDGVPYTDDADVLSNYPMEVRLVNKLVSTLEGVKRFYPDTSHLALLSGGPSMQEVPLAVNGSGKLILQIDTETMDVVGGYLQVKDDVFPKLVDGKIPTQFIPGTIQQILEYNTKDELLASGSTLANTLYVVKTNSVAYPNEAGKVYRWSGSQYTEISSSLTLGTVTDTAFDGGKGQEAWLAKHSHANKAILDTITADMLKRPDRPEILALISEDLADITVLVNEPFYYDTNGKLTLRYDPDQFMIVAEKGLSTKIADTRTVPQKIGGIPAGFKIPDAGMQVNLLLKKLIFAYQEPSFPTFICNTLSSLIEVGANITGNQNFSWTRGNEANIQPNSGIIREMVNSTVIGSLIDLSAGAVIKNVPMINNAPMNLSFRLEAMQQNNDDGNVLFYSPVYNVESVFPLYAGYVDSANPTEAMVKGMTKYVVRKGSFSWYTTCTSKRPCVAYDSAYGNLTNLFETNGYPVLTDWVKTTANFTVNGITRLYYIYTFNKSTSCTNFKNTISF